MIILEGPEGSGKSTLAKRLADLAGLNHYHFGGPPRSIDEHEEQLDKSREILKLPFIQDRSPWISEPIYSVLLGATNNRSIWPAYIAGLKAMAARVVYCRPPDEVIFENMCKIPKIYKPASYEHSITSNGPALISLYDDFMAHLNPLLIFDWTRPTADLVIKNLVRRLKKWRSMLYDTPQNEHQ